MPRPDRSGRIYSAPPGGEKSMPLSCGGSIGGDALYST